MNLTKTLGVSFLFCWVFFMGSTFVKPGQSNPYPWLESYSPRDAVVNRIPAPAGCRRVEVEQGSFAYWLRHLPLKRGDPPVRLYDGRLKSNQSVHFAVVDIDVGTRDLQQCADAVIRLRAEYLYSRGDYSAIHFNFTSGHRADFARWIEGYRPVVKGNSVRWVRSAERDASYRSFREYLDKVFEFAGTFSLSRELAPVSDVRDMRIGDVFVQGGFPGHAAIVVDMVECGRAGDRLFVLAQSYMPAQDIYIPRNPTEPALDPWYRLDFGDELKTPEWTFRRRDLRRFR